MRTPATIPVHKTLDECRAVVFGRMEEVHEEYAAKGWLPMRLNLNAGIARGILEIVSWTLFAFYEFLRRSLPNVFPLSAGGDWLNLHADQVTLERRQATQAEGRVTFTRADDTPDGNVRISAGKIVRTRPDGKGDVYRYVTLESAVLPAGENSADVLVRAEEYGQASNATVGQICEISTHIPGIAAVANGPDWLVSEGADEETDAQLQERYVLAWLELAGCTSAAYKAWALSIPGVLTAKILDQHPRGEGTVDVVVRGTAGIPTDALLEKVRAVIAEKAPVNDDWLVKAPLEVPVALAYVAEITEGTEEVQVELTKNRTRALFAGSGISLDDVPPFGIGEDFTRDRVVSVNVGALQGLKRLVWTSPADLVEVPQDGLVSLKALDVTARVIEP